MHAEDWVEGSILEPSREQLIVGCRGPIHAMSPVPTDIRGPVWHPGCSVVEACRDLSGEGRKIGVDVARPGRVCVPLLTGECAAGQNVDTFTARPDRAPSLVECFGVLQGISVDDERALS